MYQEIDGDLIKLASNGQFDVVVHGCNCFCTMGAGIAPQMAKAFAADKFKMEGEEYAGDINKLGTIDCGTSFVKYGTPIRAYTARVDKPNLVQAGLKEVIVVNAYTQFGFGINHADGEEAPLNYQALALCFQKINYIFKGKKIGLPQIGCGLAGGDWDRVKAYIQQILKDCDVTVVIYKKPEENGNHNRHYSRNSSSAHNNRRGH